MCSADTKLLCHIRIITRFPDFWIYGNFRNMENVCMHVYACMYVCRQTWISYESMFMWMCVCIYICVCVCMDMYLFTNVHVHALLIYLSTYACIGSNVVMLGVGGAGLPAYKMLPYRRDEKLASGAHKPENQTLQVDKTHKPSKATHLGGYIPMVKSGVDQRWSDWLWVIHVAAPAANLVPNVMFCFPLDYTGVAEGTDWCQGSPVSPYTVPRLAPQRR